jgi:hypothetical protein
VTTLARLPGVGRAGNASTPLSKGENDDEHAEICGECLRPRSHPIQATIIKVSEGNYGRPELLLSTGQRFSVNATNVKTLISAYGEDDADWIGMLIELVSGFTKFKGEDQESVLVKAISPGKPLAKRTVSKPERSDVEMDDEIPF